MEWPETLELDQGLAPIANRLDPSFWVLLNWCPAQGTGPPSTLDQESSSCNPSSPDAAGCTRPSQHHERRRGLRGGSPISGES